MLFYSKYSLGYMTRYVSVALLTTFAGSQCVHWYYSPDLSIPEIPPKKGELHTKLFTRLEK